MKSLPATFKLDSSERLREDVGWLFLRGDELNFDDVILHFLSNEVKINFKMFGFFMKHWIVAKFDAALIVALEMSRLVV